MTENDVPYPFPLGHMRVKELQLMTKDKVQSMLVLEDVQQVRPFSFSLPSPPHYNTQVWVGTRSGDIIIYSGGNKVCA
jgi:hypothetical protein